MIGRGEGKELSRLVVVISLNAGVIKKSLLKSDIKHKLEISVSSTFHTPQHLKEKLLHAICFKLTFRI